MPLTTVKRDSHGLYIKTGGYVFRPGRNSEYDEGDLVVARHMPQTQIASLKFAASRVYKKLIKDTNHKYTQKLIDESYKLNATELRLKNPAAIPNEYWVSHGMYGKYGKGSSDNCWRENLVVRHFTEVGYPLAIDDPYVLLPPDPYELAGCNKRGTDCWWQEELGWRIVKKVKVSPLPCTNCGSLCSASGINGKPYWIAACRECALKAGWDRLPGGDKLRQP